MLFLAVTGLALAHPMAVRVADHDTRIEVDRGEIRLTYQVQFPMHTASDRLELADSTELAAGILVRVDDQTVPLAVTNRGEQTVDHVSHAWLELRGRLPDATPDQLQVSLANYPDYPGIFRWSALVHRQYSVLDTNLRFDRAGVVRIYTEHPLHGDDWRTFEATLRSDGLASSAWAALTPELPLARPLHEAMHRAWWAPFVGGPAAPALLLVGAAAAAVAGTAAARREPTDRQAVVVAFVAWLALAMFRPGLTVVAVVSTGLAVAIAGLAAARRDGLATGQSALVAAAWATTMAAGGAGFVVWVAWGIGRLFSDTDRGTAPLLAVSVVSVLLLALRGLAELAG